MKFSSIPPAFIYNLGGIDDFLLDSAQIFVLVAKTKVHQFWRTFCWFKFCTFLFYLASPVMVVAVP
jgi:hypothetical protein